MYGGQHVVRGKIFSMWNTKDSLRYVRWPTCRWRQDCFYVEDDGFTEICTVANMSLAARFFYVEYEGFTLICTVANMSLAARLFLCGI